VTREIAQRMREVRDKRGLTGAELAERMTGLGVPWDRSIVANLENGRRQSVTVEELLALALILRAAPVHLIVPPDDSDAPYQVTAAVTESRFRVRSWIRGLFPLERLPGVGAVRDFWAEVPDDEFGAMQQGQCPACGGRPPRQLISKEDS